MVPTDWKTERRSVLNQKARAISKTDMTTALSTLAPNSPTIVPKGDELEVSASTPAEMLECNNALIQWCDCKIKLMKLEASELAAAFKHAVERKWQSSTFKRHSELAKKRLTFYEKIKAALLAGYTIVPNFPVTVFAIRTAKDNPKRCFVSFQSNYKPSPSCEQKTETLAAGEGDYKNPLPVVDVSKIESETDTQKPVWWTEATDWKDLEFPINMAKPHLMVATTNAMALKLFDDLGVLPSPHRKADPIIVARIRDPRPVGYGEPRYVSFIIAWHLDTATL